MTEHDHQYFVEQLAPYLLGALAPGEAAELEQHTAGCQSCRDELAWLTPAVRVLPETPERLEPPPGLRDRLMAEVHADFAASVPDGSVKAPSGSGEWVRRTVATIPRPALALAVVVLVAGLVGGVTLSGNDADVAPARTFAAVQSTGIRATVVQEGESARLRLANVAPLKRDQVLQAWVQRDGEIEPVRALFVPGADGRAETSIDDMRGVSAVLVTAEPTGGSDVPTSKPVVTLPVS